MNLSFFPKYHQEGPSSRLRFYPYYFHLKQGQHKVNIYPFLYDGYVKHLYNRQKFSSFKLLLAYGKRVLNLWRTKGVLIIEYELFPYLPFWFERLFLSNKTYYLNFDDNLWEMNKGKNYLQTKYNKLCKHASGVIVANDFLKAKISKLNTNVCKIPTAIDLAPYKQTYDIFDAFTIVWIGTPVTYQYILAHKLMFQQLAKKIDYTLLIIASENLERIEGVKVEFKNWDEDQQIKWLKKSRIGIMPLTDDSMAGGKSAFKIIQYLASSLPVVASNVGENKVVLEHGSNGFLCDTTDEWVVAILKLYNSAELQHAFAQASYDSSYNYDIEKQFLVFEKFVLP